MSVANVSHYQKSHVAPHFDYVDQTNVVVLFMMPFASHDANAGASNMNMTKKVMFILFPLSCSYKWNGAIDNTVGIMWHIHQHQ